MPYHIETDITDIAAECSLLGCIGHQRNFCGHSRRRIQFVVVCQASELISRLLQV